MLDGWGKVYEGLQLSPQEFYTLLEAALQEWEMPQTTITHISRPESYPFTTRREYLRIKRKRFSYEICGAPFGTGFFVSYRLIGPGPLKWWVILILWPAVLTFILAFLLLRAAVELATLKDEQPNPFVDDVSIPFVGPLLERIFPPPGHFEQDVRGVFRIVVEHVVKKAAEDLTNVQGVRAMLDVEPPRLLLN